RPPRRWHPEGRRGSNGGGHPLAQLGRHGAGAPRPGGVDARDPAAATGAEPGIGRVVPEPAVEPHIRLGDETVWRVEEHAGPALCRKGRAL
ncbi:hypothetical protein LPJ61_003165, partial [Coemansia biformis]